MASPSASGACHGSGGMGSGASAADAATAAAMVSMGRRGRGGPLLQPAAEDTAGAVEMLRSNRMLDTTSLASPRATDLYGLDMHVHGLQDESWNITRFLLLSKPPLPVTLPIDADTKTSLVVAHRGGSMMMVLKVLTAFSSHNINLTKLEVINNSDSGSALTLRVFPHVLYVDCEGTSHDPCVLDAIKDCGKI